MPNHYGLTFASVLYVTVIQSIYVYFRLCEVGKFEEPRDETNIYHTGQVFKRHKY